MDPQGFETWNTELSEDMNIGDWPYSIKPYKETGADIFAKLTNDYLGVKLASSIIDGETALMPLCIKVVC